MCDIYDHKCVIRGCDKKLDMHLGDFATDRTEIEIYCFDHLPKHRASCVLWKLKEDKAIWCIHFLTPHAKENWEINHPNLCDYEMELIEIFGDKITKKKK